jgi:hypothetical protein
MTCSYWTEQTLNAITEHAMEMYDEAFKDEHQVSKSLPESIQICGSKIDITYASEHKGTLCCTSLPSKVGLEKLINSNTMQNTEFLIWLSVTWKNS